MGFDDLKKYKKHDVDTAAQKEADGAATLAAQAVLNSVIKPTLSELSRALADIDTDPEVLYDWPIVNPVSPDDDAISNNLYNSIAAAAIQFKIPYKQGHDHWPGKTPIVFVRRGPLFELFVFVHFNRNENWNEGYMKIGTVDDSSTAEQLRQVLNEIVKAMIEYVDVLHYLSEQATHRDTERG